MKKYLALLTFIIASCDGSDSPSINTITDSISPEVDIPSTDPPSIPDSPPTLGVKLPTQFENGDVINFIGESLPEQIAFATPNLAGSISYSWNLDFDFNSESRTISSREATIFNAESNTRILIDFYRLRINTKMRDNVLLAESENRSLTQIELIEIIDEINTNLAIPIVYLTENGEMALAEEWSFNFTNITPRTRAIFTADVQASSDGRIYEFRPFPVLTNRPHSRPVITGTSNIFLRNNP